ncbi:phage tail protein [Mycobacterium sp. OTB74]|jgi:phage tail-like protein|uniref:phage tail protein n=1 Tax=Mycobacterium sp. OTB74 TaxID=1853452 RepID=UPI002474E6F4|nr:phage tail protein [Mycobacterium sp. OTB74]MDH6247045.1 phage tail-like protein [Mycobacterium sp. OTB74]
MATRDNPFGGFNFMVRLGDDGADDTIVGGFSDVTGLEQEIVFYEYRNGNDKENHPRKIPGISRTGEVALKRGVIGDLRLFSWLKETRDGLYDPRTVTITLLDESRSPVVSWVLSNAQPKKWIGPNLHALELDGVATEELILIAETIDFRSL